MLCSVYALVTSITQYSVVNDVIVTVNCIFQWIFMQRGLGICIPDTCNANDAEVLIKIGESVCYDVIRSHVVTLT